MIFALLLPGACYANRLDADNSDYGQGTQSCTPATSPNTCIISSNLIAEDFSWSGNFANHTNYQFFDFQIATNLTTPFMLNLTGTSKFAPDNSSVLPNFYGFGAFSVCNNASSGAPLCDADSNIDKVTYSPLASDGTGNSVTFTVPSGIDAQNFVFFVVENEGSSTGATVTATITPEPNSLPILGAALVALIWLSRRRLVN